MRFTFALAAIGLTLTAGAALADRKFPPITDAATKAECGECHMVYQPQMLPARSWEAIMGSLSDHFGEDASIEPLTAARIRAYLKKNAADRVWFKGARKFMRGIGPSEIPIRISDTPYFRRKHRKLAEKVWKLKEVGFKGNCRACHQAAERGDYDDDDVRIPGEAGGRSWDDDDD